MTIIALQRAAAVTFKNLLGNALPFGIALKKKKKKKKGCFLLSHEVLLTSRNVGGKLNIENFL